MPSIMKMKHFFFLFLGTLFFITHALNAQGNLNQFVVVLDAGHGGHDPGKHSKYGFKEKDIALKLVLQVGRILEKQKNIKVIYTRKKDVFLELRERAKIANQADADLFVSIHCNAHHSEAFGTETYVLGVANTKRNFNVAKQENEVILLEENFEKNYKGYDPNKPESLIGLTLVQEEYVDQSVLLASLIEDNFVKHSKRKSRGVKQASLWVMHNTYMPSVLVEAGFVTNKSEGVFLNSKKGQTSISKSISNAIIAYKSTLDFNVGTAVSLDTKLPEVKAQKTKVKPQEKTMPVSTDSVVVKTDTTKIKHTKTVLIDTVKVQEPPIKQPEKNDHIVYKVQLAAGSKPLETKPINFKGLQHVSREKVGAIYKYYYEATSSYNEAQQHKKYAKSKGYSSCFIVAYKNGKQIKIKDALKTQVD